MSETSSPPSLCGSVCRIFAMPAAGLVVFLGCAIALIFAFSMQYGFDIAPCVLCLWQRVPFGLAAACAVMASLWRPYGFGSRVLIGICALLFLLNTGLAVFHTGVERQWWEGTSGCAITPLHGTTPESWREQIMSAATGHCDQISWTFLGLSMANWNIPYSALLMFFALAAVIYGGRGGRR